MSPATLYHPGLAGGRAGRAGAPGRVPDPPDPGEGEPGADRADRLVRLPEEEARHARALRLRTGDEVRVVDGRGGVWRGRLASDGETLEIRLLAPGEAPPPLPVELGVAVAEKSRTLWLVEKAVELGALSLQPIEFRRSRSVADGARSRGFWRKAHRRAVAALKQCGGARLPEIGPVRDLHDFLGRSSRPTAEGGLAPRGPDLLLDRDGEEPLLARLAGWNGTPPVRLVVGPEGGLEDSERGRLREAGYRTVRLGPRTLRFETAAVAALAVVAQRLEEAPPPAAHSEEDRRRSRRSG